MSLLRREQYKYRFCYARATVFAIWLSIEATATKSSALNGYDVGQEDDNCHLSLKMNTQEDKNNSKRVLTI